jgi:hypothetical protein
VGIIDKVQVGTRVKITAHRDNPHNGAVGTVETQSGYGPGFWIVRLDEPSGPFHTVLVSERQLAVEDARS